MLGGKIEPKVLGKFPLDLVDERACMLVKETGCTVAILDGSDVEVIFGPAEGGVMMTDVKKGREEAFMPWSVVFEELDED